MLPLESVPRGARAEQFDEALIEPHGHVGDPLSRLGAPTRLTD